MQAKSEIQDGGSQTWVFLVGESPSSIFGEKVSK